MSSLKATLSRILGRLRRKGLPQHDAEDCLQQAYLRLEEHHSKGRVICEEAYLTRAAENISIDMYRAARRRPRVDMSIEDLEQHLQTYHCTAQPDEVLDVERCLQDIIKTLDAHSPRMREVYVRRHMGYSYKELAAQFDISESTVEKDLARALLIMMEMQAGK